MAFVHGSGAVFSLDDSGGILRALSGKLDDVSGLPGAREFSEVTAFGDSGVKNIPGLQNVSFSIKGHFDSTASTGSATVLNGLRTTTATTSFEYGPEGSTSGKVKYSGECWMTELTVDSSVKDKVSISASFQVDGTVTVGTYP